MMAREVSSGRRMSFMPCNVGASTAAAVSLRAAFRAAAPPESHEHDSSLSHACVNDDLHQRSFQGAKMSIGYHSDNINDNV